MLKRRPHTPTGWATTVLRCGTIALGTALATGATSLAGAQAASAAPATIPVAGTITGNDVNVRALPKIAPDNILYKLNRGARVNVYCHLTTDVSWDRIQLTPQQWVSSNYVNLGGKTVPTCASLGLGEGDEDDNGITEPGNGDKTTIKVGPIILSNTINNNTKTR